MPHDEMASISQGDPQAANITVEGSCEGRADLEREPRQVSAERFARAAYARLLQCTGRDDEFTVAWCFTRGEIAPFAPGFETDRLGALIDAFDARGIEVMGWMPTLHDPSAASAHPAWRAEVLDEEGRAHPQEEWLCPAEPAVIEYEGSIAGEIVERYPKLRGLYLDFFV